MTNRPSPLSARVALAEARLPEEPRRVLLAGTTGETASAGSLRVRAGSLPLFRAAQGGLKQCVRVRLDGPIVESVAVTIRSGETRLDTATLAPAARSVDLYVPEVTAPETVVVELCGSAVPVRLEPQRKWRIFLVHHSHLDLGYTDLRPAVLRHQADYLDSVLDLCAATAGWPGPAKFRWTVESNLVLQHWLAARPRAARDEFFEQVQEGRIEVCAMPFTVHTGLFAVEELARLLDFARRARDRYDIRVDTAMQTDVPGAVAGLPEALASAGVGALSVAWNYAERAAPWLDGEIPPRLFRWEAPSGRGVTVWQTGSPQGIAYLEGNLLGLAESFTTTAELLPEYLAALALRSHPYGNLASLGLPPDLPDDTPYPHDVLHLRVQGATADNAAPSLRPAEVVRAWNDEWAYPQLRCATNREFFADAESSPSGELPTFAGDWGDWWVDGAAAGARAVGAARRAQGRLRTARSLHAMADALASGDERWPGEVERAYDDLALFGEHTWCAANPEGDALDGRNSGGLQWQAKSELAFGAEQRAEDLLASGAARLSRVSPAAPRSLASFVVMNPSGRPRTDVARVFVPASRVPMDVPLDVFDVARGEAVRCAIEVRDAGTQRNRPPGRVVSLLARDVPALGYRTYALREGRPEPADRCDAEPLALATDRYRLELNAEHGAVARLLDRQLDLDLVDGASPFPFAAAIADVYLPAGRSTRRLSPGAPPSYASAAATDWLVGSRSFGRWGAVARRSSTAVEETVTIRLQADGMAWLETTYRLTHGVPRLDVEHRLHKLPVREKEGLSFAFPFALRDPKIELELTGSIGGPAAKHVPGGARHVRAMRHWVVLQDAGATVAWVSREAALVQLGNLHLPFPPYPATADGVGSATVVSTAMGNAWDTNFPLEQSGETVFTYAVASAGPDTSARGLGVTTASAVTQPLVAVLGARDATAGLAEGTGSFGTVDRDDVEVLFLGAAADGSLVATLHSHAAEEVAVDFGGLARILPGEVATVRLVPSQR